MRISMLMHRRGVWPLEKLSVSSCTGAVRALEPIPGFCSLQSLRGRLIVSSELLWFKVIERGRPSRGTHEWFSSSLRPFSRSACNVAFSNFLSWLRENFLPRGDSRRLLCKVTTFCFMINSTAIKRNLLRKIFHLPNVNQFVKSIFCLVLNWTISVYSS